MSFLICELITFLDVTKTPLNLSRPGDSSSFSFTSDWSFSLCFCMFSTKFKYRAFGLIWVWGSSEPHVTWADVCLFVVLHRSHNRSVDSEYKSCASIGRLSLQGTSSWLHPSLPQSCSVSRPSASSWRAPRPSAARPSSWKMACPSCGRTRPANSQTCR